MNGYYYVYYRLYKYSLRTEKQWGNSSMPEWVSLFTISILLFLNIGSILMILKNNFVEINPSNLLVISVVVFIFSTNYFMFIRKKNYLVIEKKFEFETKKSRIINTLLVWIYIIFSFLMFYVILPNRI